MKEKRKVNRGWFQEWWASDYKGLESHQR